MGHSRGQSWRRRNNNKPANEQQSMTQGAKRSNSAPSRNTPRHREEADPTEYVAHGDVAGRGRSGGFGSGRGAGFQDREKPAPSYHQNSNPAHHQEQQSGHPHPRRGGWRLIRGGRGGNQGANPQSHQRRTPGQVGSGPTFPSTPPTYRHSRGNDRTPSDDLAATPSGRGLQQGRGGNPGRHSPNRYMHQRRRKRTHSIGVGTAWSSEDEGLSKQKKRLETAAQEGNKPGEGNKPVVLQEGANTPTPDPNASATTDTAPSSTRFRRHGSYTPPIVSSDDECIAIARRRNGSTALRLAQEVHWTDGTTTTLRTLRELLFASEPILMEMDTPVVSPSKPNVFPPIEAMLPSAMTVDSVATPNTFRILHPSHLPPPMQVPPTSLNLFEFLMSDFDPVTNSFAWTATAESRAKFFGNVMTTLHKALPILQRRPLLRMVAAPAYVLGDIHGNFSDLFFFMQSLLSFGDIRLTTNNILCLGDYVDRGEHSIECVILLISLMLMDPEKVTLLRGNHEDRVVCGDKSTYGVTCLFGQCTAIFGDGEGRQLFASITSLFRHFPLAAFLTTDNGVALCTHGGFPRFSGPPKEDDQLQALRSPVFPRFLTLFPNNPLAKMPEEDQNLSPELPPGLPDLLHQRYWYSTFDFLWADPTLEDSEVVVDEWGFGRSNRGQAVVSFTAKAVDTFLNAHNCDMLFRAHQEKAHGIRVSKSSRVLTIFSSSNYLGHGNGAGCAVVFADGSVKLVVKAGEEPNRK